MSIRARKYNTKLHKYEDILLPDECRLYEEDTKKMRQMMAESMQAIANDCGLKA